MKSFNFRFNFRFSFTAYLLRYLACSTFATETTFWSEFQSNYIHIKNTKN